MYSYLNQNQEENLIEGIRFEVSLAQQIVESEEFILNNAYGRCNMLNTNPGLLEALDKVKILNTMPDGYMTIQMVADYFEVSVETIRTSIKRNQEELFMNGLVVLKGEELKGYLSNDFVKFIINFAKIRHLTLLNRRVILNIAMLLRDSIIAKAIRYTILNVLDTDEGKILLQQEVERLTKERDRYKNAYEEIYPLYIELKEKLKEKDKDLLLYCDIKNTSLERMCIAENKLRRAEEELQEYRRRELYEVEEEIPEGVSVYYDPRNGYKPTPRYPRIY